MSDDDAVLANLLRRFLNGGDDGYGYASWGDANYDRYLTIDERIDISVEELAAIERVGADTFWNRTFGRTQEAPATHEG